MPDMPDDFELDPFDDPHEDDYAEPEGQTCHNCGAIYDGGNRCTRCGCGDPLDSGDFCHGCGTALDEGGDCPSALCDDNTCQTWIPT